jgi:hypothetical protein
MRSSEIKKLLISSMDADADTSDLSLKLEEEGVSYDFGKGFSDSVLAKLFPVGLKVKREIEFVRNMNFAFKSIAISGVAAIIVLMISIFLMEGSISIDSFLGLRDNYDESIICLLTGK